MAAISVKAGEMSGASALSAAAGAVLPWFWFTEPSGVVFIKRVGNFSELAQQQPAVHVNRGAGDVIGLRRGEKNHGAYAIVRVADATGRDVRHQPRACGGAGERGAVHVGENRA